VKTDINKDILNKIENCNEPENIKNFLKDALQLEYDVNDQSKPNLKKKYIKMIYTYNKG
jgi:hypothetical protein